MHRPGELSLIEALRAKLQAPGPNVLVGIGDDAAVVRARPVCLTSVDAVVEGVHFQLGEGWLSHREVGAKALGAALSDIAAMGVEAGEAYLVLGVPKGTTQEQALAVGQGAADLAAAFGVSIAGGDVVSSPVLSVCVTVTGWSESVAAPVRRSGAMPGDLVGVTGALGGSACGLAMMQRRVDGLDESAACAALARARAPQPRLLEGKALAGAEARAMIDISDGLATDAAHVGVASGLTLEIDLSLLPLHPAVEQVAGRLGMAPWQLAATGGEDYELCVCVSPSQRAMAERALAAAGGAGITWVGEAVPGPPGARFTIDGGAVELTGFEHRW